MTEERRYGINWVDLIIKVILVALFVLLICWLFPMPKLDTFYDKVFSENINTMKEAARDYYTSGNLPTTIGETKSLTLKQMIDTKMILEFSDKDGNACDASSSYVSVTKTLDSEYALKVQLTCGDETDYIIDTIGCNGTCLLSDVNNNAASNQEVSSVNPEDTSYNYDTSKGVNTVYYPLSGTTYVNSNPTTTTKTTTTKTTTTKKTTSSSTSTKNENSSSNSGSSNSSSSNKKLYYEQARIVKSYGNWIEGTRSGSNIETKTERVNYYTYTPRNSSSSKTSEYRTSSYVFKNDFNRGKSYSYELQLIDIPSSVNNVTLKSSRYFNSADYTYYVNNRDTNLYMTGNDMLHNSYSASAAQFKRASLKSHNFTYAIGNPYKVNGVWRVNVTVILKSATGVTAFREPTLNSYLYYVPIYFKVNYGSSSQGRSVVDTEANAYKYSGYSKTYAYSKTKRYYRYVTETVDYNQTKWTTSKNVSGYRFTGRTQYR